MEGFLVTPDSGKMYREQPKTAVRSVHETASNKIHDTGRNASVQTPSSSFNHTKQHLFQKSRLCTTRISKPNNGRPVFQIPDHSRLTRCHYTEQNYENIQVKTYNLDVFPAYEDKSISRRFERDRRTRRTGTWRMRI